MIGYYFAASLFCWTSFLLIKKYNITINNIMFSLTDNIIYYKSLMDIKYKLYKKKILFYMRDIGFFKENNDIFFIKDGTCLFSSNSNLISNLDITENDRSILDYDFILYNNFDIEMDILNNIILHSRNKSDYNFLHPKDFNLAYSEIKFLLIELIFDDEYHFKIDLKTSYYNFYIINNVINNDVIAYILNFYYNSIIDSKYLNETFEVSILDDVANEIILNKKSIVLGKNDYKLID